jgi:hypothetical protein
MNVDLDTLSAERRTILAPKLRALLEDFARLQELEDPDVQPVSTEWLMRSADRDR